MKFKKIMTAMAAAVMLFSAGATLEAGAQTQKVEAASYHSHRKFNSILSYYLLYKYLQKARTKIGESEFLPDNYQCIKDFKQSPKEFGVSDSDIRKATLLNNASAPLYIKSGNYWLHHTNANISARYKNQLNNNSNVIKLTETGRVFAVYSGGTSKGCASAKAVAKAFYHHLMSTDSEFLLTPNLQFLALYLGAVRNHSKYYYYTFALGYVPDN